MAATSLLATVSPGQAWVDSAIVTSSGLLTYGKYTLVGDLCRLSDIDVNEIGEQGK